VETNELGGGGGSAAPAPLRITAEEVAGMLDISARTLWRLVSARRIVAPLKIGGSTRWRRAEIEAWVAAGCPVPGRGERARP
jgi:excisionase family DNA binding protein